ncbi:MAG: type II secretion system F family protein [Nocardioidaceae bacterium]|nr:type II secretion system F family protein [Nocardioidaceae bacterium]
MTWPVALLAGAAVLLCFSPSPTLVRRRAEGLVLAAPAPVLAVLLVAGRLPARRVVLLVVVLASLADLARRFRRRRRGALADRRAEQLLEACEAMAADLKAGLPPVRALEGAVATWPDLAPVLRAAQWGADVPEALRALAGTPGGEQARVVAAAWQVAHRTGAGLAPALSLAARSLREERATAAIVATELAGARATATLLALLPLGLLVLGSEAGGNPAGFLTESSAGLACLALGLLLIHAGLAWIDVIADGIGR